MNSLEMQVESTINGLTPVHANRMINYLRESIQDINAWSVLFALEQSTTALWTDFGDSLLATPYTEEIPDRFKKTAADALHALLHSEKVKIDELTLALQNEEYDYKPDNAFPLL